MVHTNKKDIQLCYNVHQKGGGPSRTGEIPVPGGKSPQPLARNQGGAGGIPAPTVESPDGSWACIAALHRRKINA